MGSKEYEYWAKIEAMGASDDYAQYRAQLEGQTGIDEYARQYMKEYGLTENELQVKLFEYGEKVTLKPGVTVDRYGSTAGFYISPEGVAFEARALPSTSLNSPYKVYEIIKPIKDVSQSKVLPWFGQPGQGTQYKLSKPVKWYIDNGYIKEVTK